MPETPEKLAAHDIAAEAIEDNLQRSVAAGQLTLHEDGTLQLPEAAAGDAVWATVRHGPPLDCRFLFELMHMRAYGRGAVPYGCSECFKVKVALKTLRQLVAAWGLGKRTPCWSKWGIDLHNRHSQDVYAGYFYTSGLDAARALYKVVRGAVDADPLLGPDVRITIKRGCSEYEAAVGPSDTYQFTPEMQAIEAALRARFREPPRKPSNELPMGHWIELAFKIGDDTYLDFTGGRRLRRATVAYDPEASAG